MATNPETIREILSTTVPLIGGNYRRVKAMWPGTLAQITERSCMQVARPRNALTESQYLN
jgi:hypothetical protein